MRIPMPQGLLLVKTQTSPAITAMNRIEWVKPAPGPPR
jgi:hypothetical protein